MKPPKRAKYDFTSKPYPNTILNIDITHVTNDKISNRISANIGFIFYPLTETENRQ